jgi:two-component system, OmpR family, phosphate regulon sensor histidine kinase PhoR
MAQSEKENSAKIRELIELNDELENYFRNTIIPQLFVDANLILRKYTPPAMKQFRFTPEHIGKPMAELVDNICYSTIMENIQEVIDSKEIFEKEIQTTDMRWFQMNIVPYIIAKNNKPNGVIMTFVDITDRIKDLRDLEKLNASHETFIYSVSHDLKAPLANIEALAQYLIETSEEISRNCEERHEEQKDIANMLDDSVKRMRSIINELAEISKIEGNYKETLENVNIENIFKEVEMTIKDKIYESQARIRTDFKVHEIDFSRKNLRSIIFNLLSNAIKYKSPQRHPEIFVKSERENGFTKITIRDNGLGIAENMKEAIFEQFLRVEKVVEGTGIGLYLVKKIVENEGGKIAVNSRQGEGSEFIVYLKAKI